MVHLTLSSLQLLGQFSSHPLSPGIFISNRCIINENLQVCVQLYINHSGCSAGKKKKILSVSWFNSRVTDKKTSGKGIVCLLEIVAMEKTEAEG